MWNTILDMSIIYSFDKSGYLRHSKNFIEDIYFSKDTHAMVTGGTSGIGLKTTEVLAKHGVKVTITGRNKEKGLSASELSPNIHFLAWDMANWEDIPSIVQTLTPLDFIVLNAGGMPTNFTTNNKGIELQFASQLFGHYYLIKELKKQNKLQKGARIVWVSSGGMYLANVNVDKIFNDPNYDKVATYANVKRAQVTLLPFFKQEFPEQIVVAMHPGWVATPGVSSAIPKFEEKMKDRLRTPFQGADTILWLLGTTSPLESGKFYFDRRQVKTHFFWFTKKSDSQIKELSDLLKKHQ